MNKSEIYRIKNIIKKSIRDTNLDLCGQTILTEVGSGYFVFTPIIALMANAKKVYAWVKDSRYGTAKDISIMCDNLVQEFEISNKIEYGINVRPEKHISEASIITNLGFVRPINEYFLNHVSENVSISGMCEAWELRPADINLKLCKEKDIRVAGTWENHPDLKIFDGCGHLAIKMVNEAGYELYQNNIIVWSNDNFGEVISSAFERFGAKKVIKTTNIDDLYNNITETDFVFFCDYHEQRKILGDGGFIDILKLYELNRGIGIVHLYGDIDNDKVKNQNIHIYPNKRGQASIMTFTLAHLGPIPIINLHAAGLKVGECLNKNEENTLVQLINQK